MLRRMLTMEHDRIDFDELEGGREGGRKGGSEGGGEDATDPDAVSHIRCAADVDETIDINMRNGSIYACRNDLCTCGTDLCTCWASRGAQCWPG